MPPARPYPTPTEFAQARQQMDQEAQQNIIARNWPLIRHAISSPLQAFQHLEVPQSIREALTPSLGPKRVDRSPMDKALNYAGAYDWGIREGIDIDDAIQAARLYQLRQYRDEPDRRDDAVWDYLENVAGLEAARRDRALSTDRRGRPMLNEAIQFGTQKAKGGLVRMKECNCG